MGAWGADTFENDTACDWIAQLGGADDLSVIEESISAVVDSRDGSLDGDAASEALAACDTLARLMGRFGQQDAYTSDVDKWVRAHPAVPPPELVGRAGRAIDRVTAQESELRQMWNEAGPDEWLAAVDALRKRLGS